MKDYTKAEYKNAFHRCIAWGMLPLVAVNGRDQHKVRALKGFIPVEQYFQTMPAHPGEIGCVPNRRFIKKPDTWRG